MINFGQLDYEECERRWPDLLNIARDKVKPERDALKDNSASKPRKQFWWQFGSYPKGLFNALKECDQAIVTGAGAAAFHQFAVVRSDQVFSHKLIVFPMSNISLFGTLQSGFHDEWRRAFGATRGATDDLTYNPTDVFINYPLPSTSAELELASRRLHDARAHAMVDLQVGLTDYCRDYHSPYTEGAPEYESIKEAAREVDSVLASLYGISSAHELSHGYGIEDLGLDESDDDIQSILDAYCPSGDFFFDDPGEAKRFNEALKPFLGARRRLYWRYRWPDAVRDEVLARLLGLNAERFAEEQAQGAQGGDCGPRRPSRPKPTASRSVEPFSIPAEVQVDLFKPQIEQLELGR